MTSGIRWTITERQGHEIYLTEERWPHIIEPAKPPEMADFEVELQQTVRLERRK